MWKFLLKLNLDDDMLKEYNAQYMLKKQSFHSVLPVYINHLHQMPKDRDYLIDPGVLEISTLIYMLKKGSSGYVANS